MNNSSFGKGVLFAVGGFSVWGFLPLYWRLLAVIDPIHILAYRILGSLLVTGIILAANRNFQWLRIFKEARKAALAVLAGFVLCLNWGLYIWAVNKGHAIEASLGYFINPLVSIVLGLLFFREKLKPLQWAAFGCVCTGVLILTILSGSVPWIALALAVSFGMYGLLKKTITLSALESLGTETLATAPLGLLLLFFSFNGTSPRFGFQNLSYLPALPAHVLVPLAFCGALSALPLYCFGQGAKLLPLSTLGFFQILSPTIQFIVGIFILGEYFPRQYYFAYSFIWLAVILHILSLRNQGPNIPLGPETAAKESK